MAKHKDRLGYIGQRFKAKDGEPVTYSIRDKDGIVLQIEIELAVPVLIKADEQMPNLGLERLELQDWFIDLEDFEAAFPPAINHFIETEDGTLFQAVPLGVDEPVWRWVTSARTRVRIHTKKVRGPTASDSGGAYLTSDDEIVIIDEEFLE